MELYTKFECQKLRFGPVTLNIKKCARLPATSRKSLKHDHSESTFLILFIFQKSTRTLLEPSLFFTMTMGHAYGNFDGLNTPMSSMLSNSFCSSSLMACGKGMAYIF